jgi:hypothetical protein
MRVQQVAAADTALTLGAALLQLTFQDEKYRLLACYVMWLLQEPTFRSVFRLLVTANVPQKRRFLLQPHDVTAQKTAFFIATTENSSNLTNGESRLL